MRTVRNELRNDIMMNIRTRKLTTNLLMPSAAERVRISSTCTVNGRQLTIHALALQELHSSNLH
jgi:hypothetical protein